MSAIPANSGAPRQTKSPFTSAAFRFPPADPSSAKPGAPERYSPSSSDPPTPPPKDRPGHVRSTSDFNNAYTLARPGYLSRSGSIYSLSRESLSSQIAQLRNIQLPNASEMKDSLKSIQTSTKLIKILADSSELILRWMKKASQVLQGLDAGDDVEWAAAAGKDGLTEVESALDFQSLIQVYVDAVESLQIRNDVGADQMRIVVNQLDIVVARWQVVKDSLRTLKRQVEVAMEWEQLRSSLCNDVSQEIESLARTIFEMEEHRHATGSNEILDDMTNVDVVDLETIHEEAKKLSRPVPSFQDHSKRVAEAKEPAKPESSEENHLIELYARMQPLRASLDFLPMRLNLFRSKAEAMFPTACSELDGDRERLEEDWTRLENDAETVRKELAEDRWVKIFRNASKQALKMMDSIQRSVTKLDESLDSNTRLQHASGTAKKIENYEAKKKHYRPALMQVMAIIERGARERLTVNGELVRLQEHIQRRWRTLRMDMDSLDSTLASFDFAKDEQLRDSMSSILSSKKSQNSFLDTPKSSPASSVCSPSRRESRSELATPSPATLTRHRSPEVMAKGRSLSRQPASRHSSIPIRSPKSSQDLGVRQVSSPPVLKKASLIPNYESPYRQQTPEAKHPRHHYTPSPKLVERPRWNTSTVARPVPIEEAYKPAKTPSPFRKSMMSRPESRISSSGSAKLSPLSSEARASREAVIDEIATSPTVRRSTGLMVRDSPLSTARSPSTNRTAVTPIKSTSKAPSTPPSKATLTKVDSASAKKNASAKKDSTPLAVKGRAA